MLANPSPWTSLEVAKLVAGLITPAVLAGFGIYIHRVTKRFEHLQWRSQKLIESRLKVYDDLAPQLNDLLCYFTYVGCWKELGPPAVVNLSAPSTRKHSSLHLYFPGLFSRRTWNFRICVLRPILAGAETLCSARLSNVGRKPTPAIGSLIGMSALVQLHPTLTRFAGLTRRSWKHSRQMLACTRHSSCRAPVAFPATLVRRVVGCRTTSWPASRSARTLELEIEWSARNRRAIRQRSRPPSYPRLSAPAPAPRGFVSLYFAVSREVFPGHSRCAVSIPRAYPDTIAFPNPWQKKLPLLPSANRRDGPRLCLLLPHPKPAQKSV